MNEIEKSYTSQVFDNGNGTRTIQSHIKPIFYNDGGTLAPIQIAFEDMGGFFQTIRNNARVYVNKDFLASQLILWNNDYLVGGQVVSFDAKNLLWVNKNDYTDFQIFRAPQASTGVLINPTTIRYANAYGPGIHFEVVITRTQFKKEIVIDSLGALEAPPTAQHLLVASFKFGGNVSSIRRREDNQEFNGNTLETNGGEFMLDGRGVIKNARIIDQLGAEKPVPVFWRDTAQGVMQFKVIPRAYLLNPDTVFPVRVDTVTSYYSGSTDRCIRSYDTGYTNARDCDNSATAELVYTTDTVIQYSPGYNIGGPNYIFWATFFPFDTSLLSAAATITAADLKINVTAEAHSGTGANIAYVLVKYTKPSPPPTAVQADWDYIDKTEYTSEKATESYTASAWNTHALTAFDIITKGGTTNTAYTTALYTNTIGTAPGKDFYISIQSSESSADPYLEITYTLGGTTSPSGGAAYGGVAFY